MNPVVKIFTVALFVAAGAGVLLSFNKIDVSSKNMVSEVAATLLPSKSDWRRVLESTAQFNGLQDTLSEEDTPRLIKDDEKKMDPNDINASKLIGLMSDGKGMAILQIPKVDEHKQFISYETTNVLVGETILNGWSLGSVDATSAHWLHKEANQEHVQFIFKPHHDKRM
ncbi:hypothetical protein [Agaribacter marinus]|uniref:Uncharacterized protein n=1 Tax=Agaribacter marinus TaxID=1431249 RepID=A0AA37WK23_9ALTE|nr:hypothetical protein [Agaribacter marinus]GLR70879.1 hypothetical protein GCM10007852_17870 [Agaribacter marinus]